MTGGIDFGIISQPVSLIFCEVIKCLWILNPQQQVEETFVLGKNFQVSLKRFHSLGHWLALPSQLSLAALEPE